MTALITAKSRSGTDLEIARFRRHWSLDWEIGVAETSQFGCIPSIIAVYDDCGEDVYPLPKELLLESDDAF